MVLPRYPSHCRSSTNLFSGPSTVSGAWVMYIAILHRRLLHCCRTSKYWPILGLRYKWNSPRLQSAIDACNPRYNTGKRRETIQNTMDRKTHVAWFQLNDENNILLVLWEIVNCGPAHAVRPTPLFVQTDTTKELKQCSIYRQHGSTMRFDLGWPWKSKLQGSSHM